MSPGGTAMTPRTDALGSPQGNPKAPTAETAAEVVRKRRATRAARSNLGKGSGKRRKR